jgi:hypothetical protein
MNEEINETTFTIEQLNALETGGNAFVSLEPSELEKEKPFYAFVKNIHPRKVTGKDGTDYGQQIVLDLQSLDGYEYRITDWNYATKKKYKLGDLIGKKVKFSKWTDKRALLEVCE